MSRAISENPDKIRVCAPDHKKLFSRICQNTNCKVFYDFNLNEIKLLFYSMLDKKLSRITRSPSFRQLISRFNSSVKEVCNTNMDYIISRNFIEQNSDFDKSLILIISVRDYDNLIYEEENPFEDYRP